MKYKGSHIEEVVLERLVRFLSQSELTIRHQDTWQTALLKRRFDIVIYDGANPLAVIEVKGNLENKNLLAIGTDQVRSALTITNARFGIVTDNEIYYIYDRRNKDVDFVAKSFDQIIQTLSDKKEIDIEEIDKDQVLHFIKKAAKDHLSENQEFLKFIQSENFIKHIQFDNKSNTYYFAEDNIGIASFENQFFNKMLGDFNDLEICRYTSQNTLFSMLNNLSFRMNGLVGMNDKSEVNYVETYLNGIEKPLIKEHYNTIIAINKRYITSCSTFSRKDDLTLWRLYSEDGRGVCLVFKVSSKNLNNHVLLQKVKYADKKGNHKELDFLKQIKEDIEFHTGFQFEFRKIGYWKHFFKPFDYSIEEEVRLLVIDNDSLSKINSDWVMTYDHSIINPIMDFKLNSKSFPIQLKEIILGPKLPEQETNIVQLQEMIRRKKTFIKEKKIDSNLMGLEVSLSDIKHYR